MRHLFFMQGRLRVDFRRSILDPLWVRRPGDDALKSTNGRTKSQGLRQSGGHCMEISTAWQALCRFRSGSRAVSFQLGFVTIQWAVHQISSHYTGAASIFSLRCWAASFWFTMQ
ncbi:hypothetical protein NDU88_008238 [Pleurodeles waltl]|uniref:Uncharacterized protein n=1 Tax=Pleurodeles waltl TaxID=8319 RepID=A0AAV7VUX3_PLEWA|nr:hypothetical protein NDU88_008238 [Pleurodeles waltl]